MTLHHQGCPPLQGCVPLDAALVLRQVGAAGALSHGHCVAREEAGGGGPGRRGRDGGGHLAGPHSEGGGGQRVRVVQVGPYLHTSTLPY